MSGEGVLMAVLGSGLSGERGWRVRSALHIPWACGSVDMGAFWVPRPAPVPGKGVLW